MAYRMSAITPDCFSDALFALYERGWGRGEDVLLSRLVGSRGRLLTVLRPGMTHSGVGHPVAYRRAPFAQGHAIAYSRRLLNDHYRGFEPAQWRDRLALIRSYAGRALLSWLEAVCAPRFETIAFACGYSLGAARGLLRRPTAARLTPQIAWRAEAERALSLAAVTRPAISAFR
jgi:hypothetical protein